MAYRRQTVSQHAGRHYRNLGNVINSKGRLAPKKFLLGTDRSAAELANKLLEKLWDEVVAEQQSAVEWMERMGGRLGDTNMVTGEADGLRHEKLALGPHWRPESLMIAEAIRRGRRQLAVPPCPVNGRTNMSGGSASSPRHTP